MLFTILLTSDKIEILPTETGAGQNGTATKWHGRQNDTVRHFGTEGHFGTVTKWHGVSI